VAGDIYICLLLTMTRDDDKWLVAGPGRFNTRKSTLGILLIGGWVNPLRDTG
jgi:hypothetical protein